jgi:regulator of ribonuclease activity A
MLFGAFCLCAARLAKIEGCQMLPTTDVCDTYAGLVHVCQPIFQNFGGQAHFSGVVATLCTVNDNTKVRAALEQPGNGAVLVVDAGGSADCALVGGQLGALAERNGWAGIIVNGYVRDQAELAQCHVGIKALGTHPRKSLKNNGGIYDVPVAMAGVLFLPGAYVTADADGVVVTKENPHI